MRHLIAPSRREVLCAGAAGLAVVSTGTRAWAAETVVRDDLAAVFQQMGLAGAFAALEVVDDRLTLVNAKRAQTRFVPASTFKIANTLIALETGALKDADELFRYDGTPRAVKAWERDMTLREAIAVSNVPVYQELARRVGLAQYRVWLERLDYGNRDPGEAVDRFWLEGPLAISPVEQARFLGRLAQGRLPASARAHAIVRDIIRIEEKDGRVLFAKTGWSGKIGWWVGWIEHGDRIAAFALNIDMATAELAPRRAEAAKALLARLGLY